MVATIDNIKIEQEEMNEVSFFFLNSISVNQADSQEVMLQKMDAIVALKKFTIQNIKIETLPSREAKSTYIRFLSKLSSMYETLEILTGQVTIEEIQAAGRSFAKKTQHPVGIYD
jgi:hypothetical protein